MISADIDCSVGLSRHEGSRGAARREHLCESRTSFSRKTERLEGTLRETMRSMNSFLSHL